MPRPPRANPGTAPASARWQPRGDAGGWVLVLAGDWSHAAQVPRLEPPPDGGTIAFDGSALVAWDAALPARLWQLLVAPSRAGRAMAFDGLPAGLAAMLEQAFLPQTRAVADEATSLAEADGPWTNSGWRRLRDGWQDALVTATFLGEVLLALGALLRGRTHLRAGDLLRQLDNTGPLSLPIVGLTCFLVGLMLAYMGGAQLDRIGAQTYIADVVTVGMVREMAGMMTGVILSGRLGAAFAAQLASMQSNEEIDALRAMGVDPIGYLVLPRLLALVAVAPLLVGFAALVGVLAGLPPAVGIYGVPPQEYLSSCLRALTWTHLWIGLFKGTLYAALIALAGCREGLHAGRNAQAVGVATTRAVVKALVWIVVAASATTVLFQSLGL